MAYTFPAGNVIWSPRDLVALLASKMTYLDHRLLTMTAVVLGESGGHPLATGKAVWAPNSPAHLSIDLGLFQLNSYYHTVTGPYPDIPPISVAACFTPHLAWEQAWKVMNKARPDTHHYNMSPWVVYKSGLYEAYMDEAHLGLDEYFDLPPDQR